MAKFVRIAAVVLFALSICAAASADDLNPPPWRGLPGSTFQMWEFSTPAPVSTPDLMNNPYGVPEAHAYPGTGQVWTDLWGGRQGIWPLSGTIETYIPNTNTPNPIKRIWVQLTWAKQVSSSTPVVWEMGSGLQGSLVNQSIIGPTGSGYPSDFWYHSTYLITLPFNPAFEWVKIDGTLLVDEMVIDTQCVPEPSSLMALGGGLLALAGLVSRKRR
jgi:hypothetical protein